MYKPKRKIRLTTTFALLRKHSACESGYRDLRKHLGMKWPDDKPINLLVILQSNGVQDMLWCIRATQAPYKDHWKFLCNMYADFAESVLPLFQTYDPNDNRPLKAIQEARSGNKIAAEEAAGAARAAEAAEAAGEAGAAWAAEAAWAAGAAWAAEAAGAAWAARAARAAVEAAGAVEENNQAGIIRKYLK